MFSTFQNNKELQQNNKPLCCTVGVGDNSSLSKLQTVMYVLKYLWNYGQPFFNFSNNNF